jgi:hypothetical protein
MHRATQLLRQRGMDAALALHPRDAFKRHRYHADMKMCFADPAIGTRGAGMAGMGGAFIADLERHRRECGGQFVGNGLCYAHAGRVRVSRGKVKNFISLFFTGANP